MSRYRSSLCMIAVSVLLTLSPLLHSQNTYQSQSGPPSVLAGAEIGYPPYSIADASGEADGFSVELLRAALQAMGRDVVYSVGTWDAIRKDLETGRVDALPLVGKTPEREDVFDFTFPYMTMNGSIIVHKDTETIHSIEDLHDKSIAVMEGDNAEEYARRTNLGKAIITTPTFSEALRMVQEKRVDAVLIQRLVALQLIKAEELSDLRVTGSPVMDFQQSFCFAVREGNSDLLALLNEGLSVVIADGTYDRLFSKWFGPLQAVGRTVDRVVIGGDRSYPPYEFLDENGEPTGFNVDLTRAIAEEIGIEVEIVLDQWSATYENLIDREIDIVQGVFYSPDRDEVLSFSQPHSIVSHVIVARKGEYTDLRTMEDLEGLSILVMDQDIMHQKALDFGYEEHIITVANQEDALKMLAEGTGDCALVAEMPALYWMEESDLNNLAIGSQVLSLDYCYASLDRSESAILIMEFTEGLASLKAKGTYRAISNKWFSVYEQPAVSFMDVLRILFFILIPIGAGVLVVGIWSLLLRKQVQTKTAELQEEINKRKHAQQKIAASEKQFREYVQHAPIGIFVVNEKGDYVDVNPSAERITGYSRYELLTMNIAGFAVAEEYGSTEQAFKKLLDTGFLSITQQFKRKDKTIGYWTIDAVKLSETRFLGFSSEISELKQAEQAIRDDRERLRVTLRSIGDGVITTDIEGKVQLMNKVAENLTGWSQQEAEGNNLSEVFRITHEYTGVTVPNPVDQVLRTGTIVELANHTMLISRSGTKYIIADSGAPIRDDRSRIIGVVLVFRDITHEERMKEHLQQVAKIESLGILAGGIAHDFNNLLSGIFGYLELAREAASNEYTNREYLDELMPIMDRARNLTRQLLTFSKGGDPVRERGYLQKLIEESVAFSLSGSNIQAHLAIDPGLWICDVDMQQIGQVIDNIVINAQQAMPKGGSVTVRAENLTLGVGDAAVLNLSPGDYVHIAIEDTGSGIPEDIIERIFDPFFTTKEHGSGIGLATCFSIVSKHDGMLTAESPLGKGALFHVYLPKADDSSERTALKHLTEHRGTGTVLVLDDEPFIRKIMHEMLVSMGYTTVSFDDGELVLDFCRTRQLAGEHGDANGIVAAFFDLTISGGLGGREVIDAIRSMCPDIPIFAMSGYSADDILAHPESYGFTASIPKPFSKGELAVLLASYLKSAEQID